MSSLERDVEVAPRQTERGARSRANLIAAAHACFNAYGYSGTRIADIVARAGMSQGAFYRHFEDKNAILLEAITEPVDELLAATGRTEDGMSTDLEALVAGNTRFFATYGRHRDILRVLREAAALRESGFLELWRGTRQRFVERIEEWLRDLHADGQTEAVDFELTAEALAAILEQLAHVRVALAATPPRPEEINRLGRVSGEIWHRVLAPRA